MFRRITATAVYICLILGCMAGIYTNVSAAENFKPEEYIEAEYASLRENIIPKASPYASGGTYLVSNASQQTNEKNIKAEDFSFLFDISEEAEYKLFMRLYIPSSSSNKLFYRWNNNEWKVYTGTANGDFYWADICVNRLKTGINKLQFSHCSTDVYYDLVYVTKDQSFTPEVPEGVEKMPEIKETTEKFTQRQTKECFVPADTDGIVFEAENASYQTGVKKVSASEGLSGGNALLCSSGVSDRSNPIPEADGWIEFSFSVEKTGKYNIWARTFCPGSGNDSWFVSVGAESEYANYKGQAPVLNADGYVWSTIKLSVLAEAGQKTKVRIRPRESGWRIDQFVVTEKQAYIPTGIEKEIKFKNAIMYPTSGIYPPVNPPAGVHPRLMFRSEDIPQIKSNIDHPKNALMKEQFMSFVNNPVELGDVIDDNARARIEAKALYYALYGDEKVGREAVELEQKAIDCEMNKRADGQERAYELILTMHSRVYDWCYDLLTAKQKENIHDICVSYCTQTETGWPPMQNSFSGHGAESVLLRGMLSFAIATYDERPDYWNCVGGRYYSEYVPERIWHQKAQMHHQGSNYGYFRHLYSCWSAKLITGMGLEPPFDLEEAGKHVYSEFTYARRPDGSIFKWGDAVYSRPMAYQTLGSAFEAMLLAHAVSKDPYVTDELMRYSTIANSKGLAYYTGDPAVWLLLYDPTVEPKSITELPHSYYFGSPMGVMFARTGWQEGIDSDSVAAVMFINEYMIGGHQHKDCGSFQLWYRGPLASEAGIYDLYGTANHKEWTFQSTAHNCLIVYDPKEPPENFSDGVNDGGQKGTMFGSSFKDIVADDAKYHRASVEGQEIDPDNPNKPYYTYLKGNLKNAYSDKISEYTRSFMFLDLKEKNVPAALIVFDRVTTPDDKLEKRWLLHGQAEPEIQGSRSTWGTLPFKDGLGRKYTGKMVVDSLLPADNKVTTDVLGGAEEGWNIINGVNIYHINESDTTEDNTYRMEKRISGEKTTYFLNCLQVTDESNKNVYNTKLIDTKDFYGVEISDRVAMFSKSGKRVASKFEISGQSSDKVLRYSISDVEAGKWKITADGEEFSANVSEEGGVLSFEIKASNITAERTGSPEKEERNSDFEESNPITVRMGGEAGPYIGFKIGPKIVNNKLMVPASGLATAFGLKTKKVFLGESFTDEKYQTTCIFKPDSNVFNKNKESLYMTNTAYYENGELMVELRAFAEAFNYDVFWNNSFRRVFLVENKPTIIAAQSGYAKVVSLKNDYEKEGEPNHAINVGDGVLSTVWAADGVGRYIDIVLDKEETISDVEIIFNPNANRIPKFEIQISSDGVKYESCYVGEGSPDADGTNWETFKLDVNKLNKGKYLRYIGNGSNRSSWNGVKEMRFKIGQELVTWEEKPYYAKVNSIRMDDGEVDPNCIGENLIDNNNRTVWAALGTGRYVDFVLEEAEDISGLDIVFNPNSKRTAKFDIMVSEDGINYIKIFSGRSNPDVPDNTVEHFDFDTVQTARYIRYVGNGSNISQWNGVKEIRIVKE